MQSSLGFRLGLGVHKAIRWYYTAGKVRHIGIELGRQVDYWSVRRDSERFGAPDCFWVVKLPREVCATNQRRSQRTPSQILELWNPASEAEGWTSVRYIRQTTVTGWRVHSLHITSHLQAWTGRPQTPASFCFSRWRRCRSNQPPCSSSPAVSHYRNTSTASDLLSLPKPSTNLTTSTP